MEYRSDFHRSRSRLKGRLAVLAILLGIMWLLELVDVVFLRQALNRFGVWPRQPDGLWGIFLMPFLHGGLAHLGANTLPFLVLGGLVLWRRARDFLLVTVLTTVFTGLTLWLFGSSRAVYIGASGLVFGYFGFLLFRGYYERSPQSLLVAMLVIVFYGGLLLGIVPQGNSISWEAHLLGFLTGALSARLLSSPAIAQEPPLITVTIDEDD